MSGRLRERCSTEKLSALMDGDLSARESARVRAHVEECASCGAALAELTSLREALAAEAAYPPEPRAEGGDGWAALAARLGPSPTAAPWMRWRWLLAPATAAILVVVVGGGGFLWRYRAHVGPTDDQLIAQAEGEFRKADAQYLHALDKLRQVTRKVQGASAAPTEVARRKAFETAEASLEAATEQCRQVTRSRPADADAEALLFAAYRKQISFFQTQLLSSEVRP